MVNPSPPLISIIIATYNAAQSLQRAIDSVVAQSLFLRIELIIIDGGSEDGTVDIIRSNEAILTEWISEKDSGNYAAFNKGIRRASGEWIYILGADDYLWSSNVLALIAPYLINAKNRFSIVYGRVALVNKLGEILTILGEDWKSSQLKFRDRMTLPHQGVFHHKDLFKSRGFFNETFKHAGDYEFLLRELKTTAPLFVSDLIIAGYQHGGGSSILKNALAVLIEFRKAQKLNGQKWPSYCWIALYARTSMRIQIWRLLGVKKASRLDDWLRQLIGLPKLWTRI